MIPQEILNLFNQQMVGHVGTRDSKLQTSEVMIWGAKHDSEKNTMTIFIPGSVSEKTLNNLQDNKKIALVLGEPCSHTLYQLKGTYLSHHPSSDEEMKLQDEYVDKFYEGYLKNFGYPPEITNSYNYKPGVAITFHIEDIFVQTPGPNAGNKIY